MGDNGGKWVGSYVYLKNKLSYLTIRDGSFHGSHSFNLFIKVFSRGRIMYLTEALLHCNSKMTFRLLYIGKVFDDTDLVKVSHAIVIEMF